MDTQLPEIPDPYTIKRNPMVKHNQYSVDYRDAAFMTWYRAGRPILRKFQTLLEPDPALGLPSLATLNTWINSDEFQLKAAALDEQVQREIQNRLVQEKVEMLNRHAALGRELQDKTKEYLDEHWDEIKPANAIKLLLAAIQIERESMGIASALEKMTELSDDKLLEQAMQLLRGYEVVVEPYDNGESYSSDDPSQEILDGG